MSHRVSREELVELLLDPMRRGCFGRREQHEEARIGQCAGMDSNKDRELSHS